MQLVRGLRFFCLNILNLKNFYFSNKICCLLAFAKCKLMMMGRESCSKNLAFNNLIFNTDHPSNEVTISAKIFPYKSKEIKKFFKAAGLKRLSFMGV